MSSKLKGKGQMFSRFHDRFGTAGVVIGVVALIVALGGSAFAASGGLNPKQKKEVKAIAKSFQGKGEKGDTGAPGTNGTNGVDGTNGTSAETATFAGAKGSCTEGGAEVKSASPTVNVCNGVKGTNGKNVVTGTEATGTGNCTGLGGATVEVEGEPATKKFACNGKEGSPWTAGGTLPSGKTETGSFLGSLPASKQLFMQMSFAIPLASALTGANTTVVKVGEAAPAQCDDGVAPAAGPEHPEADSGKLCIFLAGGEKIEFSLVGKSGGTKAATGASTAGAILLILGNGTSVTGEEYWGTFAVTG